MHYLTSGIIPNPTNDVDGSVIAGRSWIIGYMAKIYMNALSLMRIQMVMQVWVFLLMIEVSMKECLSYDHAKR